MLVVLQDFPLSMFLAMSSQFFNLQVKTSQYHQMEGFNERISEWAHLFLWHYWFSRYMHLKFEKQGVFLAKFPIHYILTSWDITFDLWDFKIDL